MELWLEPQKMYLGIRGNIACGSLKLGFHCNTLTSYNSTAICHYSFQVYYYFILLFKYVSMSWLGNVATVCYHVYWKLSSKIQMRDYEQNIGIDLLFRECCILIYKFFYRNTHPPSHIHI